MTDAMKEMAQRIAEEHRRQMEKLGASMAETMAEQMRVMSGSIAGAMAEQMRVASEMAARYPMKEATEAMARARQMGSAAAGAWCEGPHGS